MQRKRLPALRLALLYCLVAAVVTACGSGGGGSNPDPFDPVIAELDASVYNDITVIAGDVSGRRWTYSRGRVTPDSTHLIASASKWLTSATLMTLVEQGVMSLTDRPQDYLAYWSNDPADPRSRITLAQLLAFTAGFGIGPQDGSCVSDGSLSLDDCVRELYDGGLAFEPGTTYYYGPAHMQVAARMAEVAAGQAYTQLFRLQLGDPLGLSASSGFFTPSVSNPRAGGGATSTATDYADFLSALLSGQLISDLNTFNADRTAPPVVLASRPDAVTGNGYDWHYAFGAWRECDAPVFDASCAARYRLSSAGAFGWYPWIDFDRGYFVLIAVAELSVPGSSPAAASVALGARIRPLIETALGR